MIITNSDSNKYKTKATIIIAKLKLSKSTSNSKGSYA